MRRSRGSTGSSPRGERESVSWFDHCEATAELGDLFALDVDAVAAPLKAQPLTAYGSVMLEVGRRCGMTTLCRALDRYAPSDRLSFVEGSTLTLPGADVGLSQRLPNSEANSVTSIVFRTMPEQREYTEALDDALARGL